MSGTPVRQRSYSAGVALWGALLAYGLVMVAVLVYLAMMAEEKDPPPSMLVAIVSLLALTGGLCLYAGAALYYQARPIPRSTIRDSLVWRPPLVTRIATVASLVSLSIVAVALAMSPDMDRVPVPLLVLGGGLTLLAGATGARLLVACFEADHWGIRCTNPLTTVRIPWSDVKSLEGRGKSVIAQRIVAVTTQGQERMLWVFDPRVPVSRDAARVLVAELEEVRQSASRPVV